MGNQKKPPLRHPPPPTSSRFKFRPPASSAPARGAGTKLLPPKAIPPKIAISAPPDGDSASSSSVGPGKDVPVPDLSPQLTGSKLPVTEKLAEVTASTEALTSKPATATIATTWTPAPAPSSSAKEASAHPAVSESQTPVTPSQTKLKWVDLIKGPSAKMTKKGTPFLLDSGEKCVLIPNEVIQRNHRKWDCFIIGQFHRNLPSHGALHAIFNGIWSNKARDITVSKLGPRTVLIRIPNSASRIRVLSQGMWSIEGQTMFVADWSPGLNPELPELTEVPVWLEFREVPPHFFSEEGLEHIAGLVGDPVVCHPQTQSMTNLEVAKVLTIIDPTKDLPEAVNAQFGTGEISRIKVSCPWLPPICKHCHAMGHSIRRCPTAPIMCEGCNSTAHPPEMCPKLRTKTDLADKSLATPPSFERQKEKPFPKKGKRNTKAKPSVNPVKEQKRVKEQAPLIGDKSKGKGKAIETQWVSVSPKPKKGRNLVVDIGLEELKASSSKQKRAPPLKPPSKTSSTPAVSTSKSDSSQALSSESESDQEPSSSSSASSYEEEKATKETNHGFTKVLSKKEKQKLKKQTASFKGAHYYLK
ncbi:hypothetical protein V5N11_016097 [Cardamine amara subsp. amara]|uniref:DUF4283 domain-containing protein n=1 Tax=Cardamine amara subsp. amara TaxID=228776 RepID=A0ABD1C6P7_CARAN